MASRFISLRDACIRASVSCELCLVERCGRREPRKTTLLQMIHKCRWEHTHDGRHCRGRQFEESLTLRVEVGQDRITGRHWHRRTPRLQKFPYPFLSVRISARFRIGDPYI